MPSLLFLIFSLLLASLLPAVGVPADFNVLAVAVFTASPFVLAAVCDHAVVGALALLASLFILFFLR
jgi:hypothetical protein